MSPTLISGIIIVICIVILFIMLAVGASNNDDPWGKALLSGTIIGFITGSALATAAGFIYWQRTMLSSGLVSKFTKFGGDEDVEDVEDFEEFEELEYVEPRDEKLLLKKFNELAHALGYEGEVTKVDEIDKIMEEHLEHFLDSAKKIEKAEIKDLLDEIVAEKVLSSEAVEKLEKIRNELL